MPIIPTLWARSWHGVKGFRMRVQRTVDGLQDCKRVDDFVTTPTRKEEAKHLPARSTNWTPKPERDMKVRSHEKQESHNYTKVLIR